MELTRDEQEFIARHGLNESDIFDGTSMSTIQRKAYARDTGRNFLIGAPCKKGGHRIKTPNSDCIQCNPAVIAYQKRHRKRMTIYVARSPGGSVSKVGISENVTDRHRQMNSQSYGGLNDWEVVFKASADRAGELEAQTLKILSGNKTTSTYQKDGRLQEASEIVSVSAEDVVSALRRAAKELGIGLEAI